MKLVAFDYGTKRVGVAISDAEGRMAFPKAVLPNDRMLMMDAKKMVSDAGAVKIIVGESKARDGSDNPVMKNARQFADELARETGLPVEFEPEFYSSAEARLLKEQSSGKPEQLVDAEAAAVILNSYIARTKNDAESV